MSESELIKKGADATIGTFENAVRFARKSDYWEKIVATWTDKSSKAYSHKEVRNVETEEKLW